MQKKTKTNFFCFIFKYAQIESVWFLFFYLSFENGHLIPRCKNIFPYEYFFILNLVMPSFSKTY